MKEESVSHDPPRTPDGRYIVIKDRLWRASNPSLSPEQRAMFVAQLMDGRRAVGQALRHQDQNAIIAARDQVNVAKIALGERGPVWWSNGDPDLNRHLIRNTTYASWYNEIDVEKR